MRLIDTGAAVTPSTGCASISVGEAFCADEHPRGLLLEVVAGDQDDYVDLQATRVDNLTKLSGGAGADTLIGTPRPVNRYDGGSGADTFIGRGTVDYSMRTNPVRVKIGDGLANDGEAGEGDNIPDELTGVWGGEASDTIKVLDSPSVGRAYLAGGNGNDRLIARNHGLGAVIAGGAGDDFLRVDGVDGIGRGDSGDELLIGGKDAQYLGGGPGADVIMARAGRDFLRGGGDADTLSGGHATDSVSGGPGDDTIYAEDGTRDALSGGTGTDSARVDEQLDRVRGIEELL